MRKITVGLETIKNQISALKGKGIEYKVNIGRKKIRSYAGTITNVYPSVFTVKNNDGSQCTYSYTDVLCGDFTMI